MELSDDIELIEILGLECQSKSWRVVVELKEAIFGRRIAIEDVIEKLVADLHVMDRKVLADRAVQAAHGQSEKIEKNELLQERKLTKKSSSEHVDVMRVHGMQDGPELRERETRANSARGRAEKEKVTNNDQIRYYGDPKVKSIIDEFHKQKNVQNELPEPKKTYQGIFSL